MLTADALTGAASACTGTAAGTGVGTGVGVGVGMGVGSTTGDGVLAMAAAATGGLTIGAAAAGTGAALTGADGARSSCKPSQLIALFNTATVGTGSGAILGFAAKGSAVGTRAIRSTAAGRFFSSTGSGTAATLCDLFDVICMM